MRNRLPNAVAVGLSEGRLGITVGRSCHMEARLLGENLK